MGRTQLFEIRTDKHMFDIAYLAEQHRNECAAHIPYKPEAIVRSCEMIFKDSERKYINCWIIYSEGKPIAYAVAVTEQFFFNDDYQAKLEILYVLPEYRGSWAAIKLVKAYEEWARLNLCLQLYVGIARLQTDDIKHIRKLFPKLGYAWCGTYYVKETI